MTFRCFARPRLTWTIDDTSTPINDITRNGTLHCHSPVHNLQAHAPSAGFSCESNARTIKRKNPDHLHLRLHHHREKHRMHEKTQECYDDAMNAADEHGIIHPEICKEPFNGGRSRSQQANTLAGAGAVSIDFDNSDTDGEGNREGAARHNAPSADDKGSRTSAPVQAPTKINPSNRDGAGVRGSMTVEHGLLGVLQELCELARPEIAAASVVASVCKVG